MVSNGGINVGAVSGLLVTNGKGEWISVFVKAGFLIQQYSLVQVCGVPVAGQNCMCEIVEA